MTTDDTRGPFLDGALVRRGRDRRRRPRAPGLPLLLALLAAGPLAAHPDLVIDCERAAVPPVVDADLADWDGAAWLPFGAAAREVEAAVLGDDGPTEPPGTADTDLDLSGRVGLRWDDDFLYLAAAIADNVVDSVGTTPQAWFHRDGVALFFDVPGDGDGAGWVTGDHALSFGAGPGGTVWWRRGTPEGHLESPAPAEVTAAARPTPGGYLLEARLPLALLASLTPGFAPPFAGREVGFLFLVTDPDGGAQPFGGQVMYGGRSDDDAGWSRLRFVGAGAARAPRLEPSPAWEAFRARLDLDLALVGPFFVGGGSTARGDTLQSALGDWYFERYLGERPSRVATKALWMACTLWGNAGNAARLRGAVDAIGPDEDVWEEVVPGLRQALLGDDRFPELLDLLEAAAARVRPLKSRSTLLFALAESWVGQGRQDRARQALAQIVRWRASPWHVGRAGQLLRELERRGGDPAAPGGG